MYSTIPPSIYLHSASLLFLPPYSLSRTVLSSCGSPRRYRAIFKTKSTNPWNFRVWVAIFLVLTMIGPSVQLPQNRHLDPGDKLPEHPHSPTVASTFAQFRGYGYINIWIYNLAYYYSQITSPTSKVNSTTAAQKVQLKSGIHETVPDTTFPVFRFYSFDARAYIAKSNESREIAAKTTEPFSPLLEWEWIPQPKYFGTYLRNKATKHFLCFNKQGAPTARKRLSRHRCLLSGIIPRQDLTRNQRRPPITQALKIKRKPPLDLKRSNISIARSDPNIKFSIPAAIQIVSKTHKPTWFIGFCANGRAFANNEPYSGSCHSMHLPTKWNMLYVCPPVPKECQAHECLPGNHHNGKSCSSACQLAISCGGISGAFSAYKPRY